MKAQKSHEEIARPFFEKAERIEKYLTVLKNTPLPNKISRQITDVFTRYEEIQKNRMPFIEKNSGHLFSHPDLFLIVFLYKEISKIFNEVNQLVTNDQVCVEISPEVFSEMMQLRENLLALAFIGDSALELGVIRSIWPEGNSLKIPQKGNLDADKKIITAGEKQARLWDFLVPGDEEIPSLSPPSARVKSSRFEAIFGIIYLEGGLDAVETAILMLKKNLKNSEETD